MPDITTSATTASTVALEDLYQLDNSGNAVSLDIKTGGIGESSVTNVRVSSKIFVEGFEGSFDDPLPIGTNADLNGKTLKIRTLIVDFPLGTNDTFVEIMLSGGTTSFKHRMEKTVAAEGESVLYTADIEFIKR